MEAIREYIRRYSLEKLLSPDLVEELRPLRKGPGELIVRSGGLARSLCFLVEGRAKAYSTLDNGQSILASFFLPFDVLGEAELFSSDRYALNVEALTESLCLALPTAAIKKAAERNSILFMYLCGRMGEKLADRVLAESINLRYPVETRLASYLLASMDDEGLVLGTDDLGELADFIGASYRQLARVVREFRDEGILDRTRGQVRVVDKERLLPLARDLYMHSGGGGKPRIPSR